MAKLHAFGVKRGASSSRRAELVRHFKHHMQRLRAITTPIGANRQLQSPFRKITVLVGFALIQGFSQKLPERLIKIAICQKLPFQPPTTDSITLRAMESAVINPTNLRSLFHLIRSS